MNREGWGAKRAYRRDRRHRRDRAKSENQNLTAD